MESILGIEQAAQCSSYSCKLPVPYLLFISKTSCLLILMQLFLHWLITIIILLAPPAGPAYNFIVDLYTYPGAWINGFVTAGLIYLHYSKREQWQSPWHTYLPIALLYLAANIFLAIVPFIPSDGDWNAEGYPYYVFPVVGVGVLLLGVVYWVAWTKIVPRIGGYRVVAERSEDAEGVEHVRYVKIYTKDD